MGCGSSVEGVEGGKSSQPKNQQQQQDHDRTANSNGEASTQVEDFDDERRRTSIVPPQPSSDSASPTKLPPPAPSDSKNASTNVIPVSSARISRNGEQPVLAPLDQQQQPHPYQPSGEVSSDRASLSNSVGQLDPTSEHRNSYRRFMQQAGSPTYAMKDDAPRASINSLVSNSQSMVGMYAPVNNLTMPFSPTVGAASRSSFSSSTTNSALPPMASIQRAGGGDRGLSILSQSTNASEMSGSQTSSRHTMSSDPVEGGVAPVTTTLTMSQQRSIESSTTQMSPQKRMASLPLSLEDGYLTPTASSSKSDTTTSNNNKTVVASAKREIDAAQYPYNQYGFYPLESAGENFKAPTGPREKDRPKNDNTPTQSYSGKYFEYYYVREMQRRRDEDEQIITLMTEGRELERYKYRRRPQMPLLSLTSDSVMCEEEHQKVKRCNFSLSDVKNPVQQPSPENSRKLFMDRYYSMREEKEKQKQQQQQRVAALPQQMELPSPALQIISPHPSPSTLGPFTSASNSTVGGSSSNGAEYVSPKIIQASSSGIVGAGGDGSIPGSMNSSNNPNNNSNNSVVAGGGGSFSSRYRRDVQQARDRSNEEEEEANNNNNQRQTASSSTTMNEASGGGAEKTRVLRGYPSRTTTPTTEVATSSAAQEHHVTTKSSVGEPPLGHEVSTGGVKVQQQLSVGSSTQPSLNTSHVIMGDIGGGQSSSPDSKNTTQTMVGLNSTTASPPSSTTPSHSPTAAMSQQRAGSAVNLVRAARSEEKTASSRASSEQQQARVGLPVLHTVPPVVAGSGDASNPMGGMPPSSARSVESGADPTSARGSVASLQQQFSSVRSQPLPPTPRQKQQQQQQQMEQLPGAIAA